MWNFPAGSKLLIRSFSFTGDIIISNKRWKYKLQLGIQEVLREITHNVCSGATRLATSRFRMEKEVTGTHKNDNSNSNPFPTCPFPMAPNSNTGNSTLLLFAAWCRTPTQKIPISILYVIGHPTYKFTTRCPQSSLLLLRQALQHKLLDGRSGHLLRRLPHPVLGQTRDP